MTTVGHCRHLVVCLLLSAFALAAQAQHPERRIAVTIDDLPAVSLVDLCDPENVQSMTRGLLSHFDKHGIPVTAFINEGRLDGCEGLPEGTVEKALRLWADAGQDLGNHSYSHFDANSVPISKIEADIQRGEKITRRVLEETGRELRYYRHPYLRAGSTPEAKIAYAEAIDRLGYLPAPVTIDNEDWVFAYVYARAKARGERARMKEVADLYVSHMEAALEFFEGYSRKLFDREISQILLAHASELNADNFGRLAEMMKRRGYQFVSLEEALEDAAYRSEDSYADRLGISWLQRWGLTRGLPRGEHPAAPEAVHQWFREERARADGN